jgi:phosphoenolpyruvate-protein phosphotransferase/dihydroxyacetone kinase phosphotransfer subunit
MTAYPVGTDSVGTDMVGIVVVSHSRALANAAVELASQMLHGARPRLAVAAGLDERTLGTDAVQVFEAIQSVDSEAGVVVLLDLGSAVLSAELALDLLDESMRSRVVLSAAPLVEGLVAAVVTAAGGATAAEVAAEAAAALAGKQAHLAPAPERSAGHDAIAPTAVRAVFTVSNHNGLHARPAARLVAAVRTLDAQVQLTNLTTGGGPVPASSLTRVATLGARQGHQVEVAVTGSQGVEALEQILALAARQFDEHEAPAPEPSAPAPTDGPIAVSPGIAIGPSCRAKSATPVVTDGESGEPVAQWRRLREAIAATRRDISRTRARIAREAGESDAAIFDAHLMLLDDADVLADAHHRIDAHRGAAAAWDAAIRRAEQDFAHLEDEYLRARAADVRDVGDQVLRHLLGVTASSRPLSGVVIAGDLAPAEAAALEPGVVSGIVLAYGSPSSHAAILARAKGIPMVAGAGVAVLSIADNTVIALDGGTGQLVVNPSAELLSEFEGKIADRARDLAVANAAAEGPAITRDGIAIAVMANVSSVDDAKAAADAHADGAGLVRTEFLFQTRSEPPSRDEQEAVYRAITDAFSGRKVVFRTLDAGGDKPLPFAPVEPEANPFLGVRGIRLSLRNKALLVDQLTALVRVAADTSIGVMFPMVSTVSELLEAKALLAEAAGGQIPDGLEIGIMVEVPATALKTAAFADHVDFFSIGTNDLTQYAMAAERGNPAVAELSDPMDPGVLRLVSEVCVQAGERATVSVCGELAADPAATAVLIGLGVDSLSVSAPAVAEVKQAVRSVEHGVAAEYAQQVLSYPDAAAVRSVATPPSTSHRSVVHG